MVKLSLKSRWGFQRYGGSGSGGGDGDDGDDGEDDEELVRTSVCQSLGRTSHGLTPNNPRRKLLPPFSGRN